MILLKSESQSTDVHLNLMRLLHKQISLDQPMKLIQIQKLQVDLEEKLVS